VQALYRVGQKEWGLTPINLTPINLLFFDFRQELDVHGGYEGFGLCHHFLCIAQFN
jgi:hypothetical protein